MSHTGLHFPFFSFKVHRKLIMDRKKKIILFGFGLIRWIWMPTMEVAGTFTNIYAPEKNLHDFRASFIVFLSLQKLSGVSFNHFFAPVFDLQKELFSYQCDALTSVYFVFELFDATHLYCARFFSFLNRFASLTLFFLSLCLFFDILNCVWSLLRIHFRRIKFPSLGWKFILHSWLNWIQLMWNWQLVDRRKIDSAFMPVHQHALCSYHHIYQFLPHHNNKGTTLRQKYGLESSASHHSYRSPMPTTSLV